MGSGKSKAARRSGLQLLLGAETPTAAAEAEAHALQGGAQGRRFAAEEGGGVRLQPPHRLLSNADLRRQRDVQPLHPRTHGLQRPLPLLREVVRVAADTERLRQLALLPLQALLHELRIPWLALGVLRLLELLLQLLDPVADHLDGPGLLLDAVHVGFADELRAQRLEAGGEALHGAGEGLRHALRLGGRGRYGAPRRGRHRGGALLDEQRAAARLDALVPSAQQLLHARGLGLRKVLELGARRSRSHLVSKAGEPLVHRVGLRLCRLHSVGEGLKHGGLAARGLAGEVLLERVDPRDDRVEQGAVGAALVLGNIDALR
mmetsp:Transcript_51989/g.145949  ORF Transcript_51989/g.145949 Transcript_51989/m.145949 type:complete len:319 (+) Transcript_51989:460-1416(+)